MTDQLPTATVTVEQVTEALKDVIDPELGINVVDLGLVYGIVVEDGNAVIDMTLTNATLPYVLKLAGAGWRDALRADEAARTKYLAV